MPRHLLFAAVLLAVCCAQQQGGAPADLSRLAGQLAGEIAAERLAGLHQPGRLASRVPARRHEIHPAARQTRATPVAAFACVDSQAALDLYERPVVHVPFPPSRFRLPPPEC